VTGASASTDADLDKPARGESLPFSAAARRRLGGWNDGAVTPLTAMARALYEGDVVPVREIAKLCGVSVRTLYHHAHTRGWTMPNAAPVKGGARAWARRRAQRNALAPKSPGGLMSRGVSAGDRQAAALARTGHAQAQAEQAHAETVALWTSETDLHGLAALVQALALLHGARKPRRPRPAARGRRAKLAEHDRSRLDMLADLARKMDAAVAGRRDG
jgi:hypothetical protein